jgi:hypothetical protein
VASTRKKQTEEEEDLYELLFGDEEEESRSSHASLPDLNATFTQETQEDVQITQNAHQ